jgi:ribosomal protein S18 acetylase RimI-like enzyme
VFDSLHNVLGPGLWAQLYPDWRAQQAAGVAGVLRDSAIQSWAAWLDGALAGFVSVKLDAESRRGEIWMVAVEPDAQRRGVGLALTNFAVDWMRAQGMQVAIVETGGDPGHAPARATYRKAGFTLLPIARYFLDLTGGQG